VAVDQTDGLDRQDLGSVWTFRSERFEFRFGLSGKVKVVMIGRAHAVRRALRDQFLKNIRIYIYSPYPSPATGSKEKKIDDFGKTVRGKTMWLIQIFSIDLKVM
jgi:hypothetical protein